jgi:hypothetical protein
MKNFITTINTPYTTFTTHPSKKINKRKTCQTQYSKRIENMTVKTNKAAAKKSTTAKLKTEKVKVE